MTILKSYTYFLAKFYNKERKIQMNIEKLKLQLYLIQNIFKYNFKAKEEFN